MEDPKTKSPRKRHMEDREVIQDKRHNINKGQSCLTSLVIFYDEATKPGHKGRAVTRDLGNIYV